jgi:hypothetical protein
LKAADGKSVGRAQLQQKSAGINLDCFVALLKASPQSGFESGAEAGFPILQDSHLFRD